MIINIKFRIAFAFIKVLYAPWGEFHLALNMLQYTIVCKLKKWL